MDLLQLGFDGDSAGFVSRLCRGCGGRFKIGILDSRPISFCPYCHFEETVDDWWTREQAAYLSPPVPNAAPVEPEDEDFFAITFGCCDLVVRVRLLVRDGAHVYCAACGVPILVT